MKRVTKLLSIAVVLCTVLFFSCSKDDKSPSGTHKVVYKAIGSAGTTIGVAVVSTDGAGGTETFTSLSSDSWTSKEYTVKSNGIVVGAVNGEGSNANSTLKVEIWVDGEKKAEGNSTGKILSATASYNY